MLSLECRSWFSFIMATYLTLGLYIPRTVHEIRGSISLVRGWGIMAVAKTYLENYGDNVDFKNLQYYGSWLERQTIWLNRRYKAGHILGEERQKRMPGLEDVSRSTQPFCDLQLVTRLSITIAGWTQLPGVTFYHQKLVMNHWYLTLKIPSGRRGLRILLRSQASTKRSLTHPATLRSNRLRPCGSISIQDRSRGKRKRRMSGITWMAPAGILVDFGAL